MPKATFPNAPLTLEEVARSLRGEDLTEREFWFEVEVERVYRVTVKALDEDEAEEAAFDGTAHGEEVVEENVVHVKRLHPVGERR